VRFVAARSTRCPAADGAFDSVADNLLQNALLKRQVESALQIRVTLAADASLLRVCDTAVRVSDEVLGDLLRAPVASENGLGVGLYHAARQAESCGYRIATGEQCPGPGVLRVAPLQPLTPPPGPSSVCRRATRRPIRRWTTMLPLPFRT
jgi:hypothetical protein